MAERTNAATTLTELQIKAERTDAATPLTELQIKAERTGAAATDTELTDGLSATLTRRCPLQKEQWEEMKLKEAGRQTLERQSLSMADIRKAFPVDGSRRQNDSQTYSSFTSGNL